MWKCPKCETINKDEHEACIICSTQKGERKVFCQECGSETEETAKFCKSCGAAISAKKHIEPIIAKKPPYRDSRETKKNSHTWLYSIIFAAIFFVVIVILIVVGSNSAMHDYYPSDANSSYTDTEEEGSITTSEESKLISDWIPSEKNPDETVFPSYIDFYADGTYKAEWHNGGYSTKGHYYIEKGGLHIQNDGEEGVTDFDYWFEEKTLVLSCDDLGDDGTDETTCRYKNNNSYD